MPPQRTVPPAKAVKTERTHEENQERAYIAASRRSDRSLEARVESARRASEIHKRRTGRSLRVTEQDVVNEEMYEEEDDDLPLQYRRLTAHLQTGSADFNRRLAAYLTNHVAMRSALDQAISSSYAQQYPNAPQFAHNVGPSFPSPLVPQQMIHDGSSIYRQSPYQMPTTPGFAHFPQTPMSNIGTPALSAATPSTASTTVKLEPSATASQNQSASTTISAASQQPASAPATQTTFSHPAGLSSTPNPMQQSPFAPTPYGAAGMPTDMGPLSMQLPMESQMMLGPAMDLNDPFSAMMMGGMGGGSQFRQPFFPQSFDQSSPQKDLAVHPSFDGINATLAPSALDLSAPSFTDGATVDSSLFGSDKLSGDNLKPASMTRNSSTLGGGFEDDWGSFIDDHSWEQAAG